MSRHDEVVRLRHMRDAACKAVAFCRGRTRGDLDDDELLALGLVRLLEIIGEAARSISPEGRANMPGIPWREITGTRDRLIHAYPEVDLDIVWGIVEDDLPKLTDQLEAALRSESD